MLQNANDEIRLIILYDEMRLRDILGDKKLNFFNIGLTSVNIRFIVGLLSCGGVAERSKAADCKSVDGSLREFESFPLHQIYAMFFSNFSVVWGKCFERYPQKYPQTSCATNTRFYANK